MAGFALGGVAAAILAAPSAAAVAPTGGSADETVDWLRGEGYHVQLNGKPNGSLSGCVATGVHGMRDSNVDSEGRIIDSGQHTTVHVDLSCNNTV
ncbi:MAG: hypothetical protein JHC64_02090 [Mycolicibacterium sp.]|nr:hypothetical protein [Mycolicibacterium sp.]